MLQKWKHLSCIEYKKKTSFVHVDKIEDDYKIDKACGFFFSFV
jgi:hypothetical protein